MNIRCFVPCVVFAMVLLLSVPSFAAIEGTVTDSAGAPLEGALVTFTNEADEANTVSAFTDGNGTYELALTPLAVDEDMPYQIRLGQNYPNPFNPVTTIPFSLAEGGNVTLVIYNVMGQKVATLVNYYVGAGEHAAMWNGLDENGNHVSAGVYLYHLRAGQYSESRKMLLLDGGPVSGSGGSYSPVSVSKSAAEIAELGTFTVTITHESIATYSESGISITDGQVLDFTVSGIPGGLVFVSIPENEFEMGEDNPEHLSSAFVSCEPAHTVELSAYEMSAYEITNAQYAEFLNAVKGFSGIKVSDTNVIALSGEWDGQIYCSLADTSDTYMENNNLGTHKCQVVYGGGEFSALEGKENYPVVQVSWYGAKAFANYYGLDLPTEAEWECGCRGGEQYEYGTDDGTLEMMDTTKANLNAFDEDYHSVAVGCYPANPFGLYDMAGNVYEWCHEWAVDYEEGDAINPTGPSSGTKRILRSSYWALDALFSKSYSRFNPPPETYSIAVGFRVVRRPDGLIY